MGGHSLEKYYCAHITSLYKLPLQRQGRHQESAPSYSVKSICTGEEGAEQRVQLCAYGEGLLSSDSDGVRSKQL